MAFVTSRNFELPDTPEGLTNGLWFHMWSRRLRPYNELEFGEALFWYESPTRCIVWRSKIVDVIRFPYERKKDVATKLKLTTAQAAQPYFVDAPDSGFCLSYKVKALERVSLPKPDDFRFPQQGWLRVDGELAEKWPLLGSVSVLDPDASSNLDADIHSFAPTSSLDGWNQRFENSVQEALQRSSNERRSRMANASAVPKRIAITATVFERNPDVVAEVLDRAAGICEECKRPAPFVRRSNGTPYLEVHHKQQLADGGEDTVENAVALCPNCHRQAHYA